jgi:hypothetical protein
MLTDRLSDIHRPPREMYFIQSPAEVVIIFLEDRDRVSIRYQRRLSQFSETERPALSKTARIIGPQSNF